jgi:hypothetical protein
MTDDNEVLITDKQIFEVLTNYQKVKLPRNQIFMSDYDIDYNMVRMTVEQLVLAIKERTNRVELYGEVHVPTTAWQMFKYRHKSSWWLKRVVKRWPVKTEEWFTKQTVDVDTYATFPNADYDLLQARLGEPVRLDLLRRQ